MNATQFKITEVLGEFAGNFNIDAIDMELYQRDLTVDADEFWEVVAKYDNGQDSGAEVK